MASDVPATPVNPVAEEPGFLSLRALLNSKEAGIVIGKAGKTIADMRETTGCKAGVSKSVPQVQERILSATGQVESVAKFYSLVAAALLENPLPSNVSSSPSSAPAPGTTATVRLLVSHGHMGGIIGKQGAKIKSIQDASGARMTASKDMLANSTERVVEISGTPEAVQIAVSEVAQCIVNDAEKGTGTIMFQPGGVGSDAVVSPSAYLPNGGGAVQGTPQRRMSRGATPMAGTPGSPSGATRSPNNRRTSRSNGNVANLPPTTPAAAVAPNGETTSPDNAAPADPSLRTQNISIPSDMVGCIIGRGGVKINEIRRLSGSRINIAKEAHDETGERLFSIVGAPEANEKALFLLYSSLEAEKERRQKDAALEPVEVAA